MAHRLTISADGRAEMAYTGDTPWHSLGTAVDHAMTSAEALEQAHMNWTVELAPLQLADGTTVDSHRATRRSDTGTILGVVGAQYHVVQNETAFELLDGLVGSKEAIYHTCGSLDDGARVWILAKLPGELVIAPDDIVDQYLLLANGHNGTQALTVLPTPVRVVCHNTLTIALANAAGSPRVYVRHRQSAPAKLEEARRILGIARKTFELAGEQYKALSARQLSSQMLQSYLDAVYPLTVADDASPEQRDRARDRQREIHLRIAFLSQEGRGNMLPGVRGTMWAAFNAVTEYIDHVAPIRADGTVSERRQESALFGSGAETKARALTTALAMVR